MFVSVTMARWDLTWQHTFVLVSGSTSHMRDIVGEYIKADGGTLRDAIQITECARML